MNEHTINKNKKYLKCNNFTNTYKSHGGGWGHKDRKHQRANYNWTVSVWGGRIMEDLNFPNSLMTFLFLYNKYNLVSESMGSILFLKIIPLLALILWKISNPFTNIYWEYILSFEIQNCARYCSVKTICNNRSLCTTLIINRLFTSVITILRHQASFCFPC